MAKPTQGGGFFRFFSRETKISAELQNFFASRDWRLDRSREQQPCKEQAPAAAQETSESNSNTSERVESDESSAWSAAEASQAARVLTSTTFEQ